MKPENKFQNKKNEFWANVKLISQRAGYTDRQNSEIKIPSKKEIIRIYESLGLSTDKILWKKNKSSDFLNSIINYFEHRAFAINNEIKNNLMTKKEAKKEFNRLKKKYKPQCPIPMNKQKGDKKTVAYFTAIINMIIEKNTKGHDCNYNPLELPSFTQNNKPLFVLSRRVDGAFPSIIDPKAIWEIKEYYNTTTFGSRVADGVYESQLDGFEIKEIEQKLKRKVYHYLMVDDYYTWWEMGRSYLCRIIDMLHMGVLDEALFGKEVIKRLPEIIKLWIKA